MTASDDHDTPSSAGGHSGAGLSPPSAAGHLEPYGVRVMLQSVPPDFEPQVFLATLLQELAAACVGSGASVIGHLKGLLHMPGLAVACNLTSLREGAKCSVHPVRVAPPAREEARLDLAVVVYGLPAVTIDALVLAALSRLLRPLAVTWSVLAAEPGRRAR